MKHAIGILAISALSTLAQADVSSQVVSFSNSFDGGIVSFEQFDTMGGTRELTGLSLSYDQTISLDLQMQSNGYTALNAGDWLLDTGFISLHQFGLVEGRGGGGEPGPPYIGPGAIFDVVTSDLGISDGYNNGGIDTQQFNISESFVFDASYDGSTEFDQRMFDAFTGTGTLDTFLSGFIEGFFQWVNSPNWVVDPTDPPDGPFDGPFGGDPYYGLFVDYLALSHAGDITVTYEYTTIPAPAGAGVLALAGLITTRRRR